MKIRVLVKPNSKKAPLVQARDDGSLTVYVREVASEGQANMALIKVLAKCYGVSKSRINILRGQTSRHKTVEIDIQTKSL